MGSEKISYTLNRISIWCISSIYNIIKLPFAYLRIIIYGYFCDLPSSIKSLILLPLNIFILFVISLNN